MNNKKPLVLAVDDNPQNPQFLGKLLSENGYEVGVAQDGIQALTFLKKNQPDLVLLDIMMPGMDGYGVCEEIKANLGTRHIPVIFLTAKTETEDIVKGFEVGGVDYVVKPFNSAELLARVRTHVEMKMLRGLLPICSSCKRIRNDAGFWEQIEAYIEAHSQILFSHSLCHECMGKLYGDKEWYKKRLSKKEPKDS
ncbi:MAG: response regulator [Desulfobacteraceae bacterium]|nr:response regulator [Desulfobacteraceae bacterium]